MSWIANLDARQRAMLKAMGTPVLRLKSMPVAQSAVELEPMKPVAPVTVTQAIAAEPLVIPVVPATTSLNQIEHGDWSALHAAVNVCRACVLGSQRKQAVLGRGSTTAPIFIVGEAPGQMEDIQGLPFVGPAGQLLDAMLKVCAWDSAKDVYIGNVIKCRPPGNRNPAIEEIAQCSPFLRKQVDWVKPKLLVALGRFAAHTLLDTTEPLGRLRGRVHQAWGLPVLVSYHPAYLLRNPADKAKAWEDWCLIADTLKKL